MKITPYSDKIGDYLVDDEIIDYSDCAILELSDTLFYAAKDKTDFIRLAYEYVRDNIPHSADIGISSIPYVASDVLNQKHGVCFAKAHLLAALLRCKDVPSGFCYQKVILNEEQSEKLAYHGLNGVYIEELKRWIRLDAGTGGKFSLKEEYLVFQIRKEKGEKDGYIIYPVPDRNVIECLQRSQSLCTLMENPPVKLRYEQPERKE